MIEKELAVLVFGLLLGGIVGYAMREYVSRKIESERYK